MVTYFNPFASHLSSRPRPSEAARSYRRPSQLEGGIQSLNKLVRPRAVNPGWIEDPTLRSWSKKAQTFALSSTDGDLALEARGILLYVFAIISYPALTCFRGYSLIIIGCAEVRSSSFFAGSDSPTCLLGINPYQPLCYRPPPFKPISAVLHWYENSGFPAVS